MQTLDELQVVQFFERIQYYKLQSQLKLDSESSNPGGGTRLGGPLRKQRSLRNIFAQTIKANHTLLRELHLYHVLNVPFENLDILQNHLKPGSTPLSLELPNLFEKVVLRKRGGVCLELNGLFGAVLQKLGYKVQYVPCSVFIRGQWTNFGSHLALIVKPADEDQLYLADVGFGFCFLEPLTLTESVQEQRGCQYQLARNGTYTTDKHETVDKWLLSKQGISSDGQASWVPMYTFAMDARPLSRFYESANFIQYHPDSSFTKGLIVSRPTVMNGRISFSSGLWSNGDKTDTVKRLYARDSAFSSRMELTYQHSLPELLKQLFDIELPASYDI